MEQKTRSNLSLTQTKDNIILKFFKRKLISILFLTIIASIPTIQTTIKEHKSLDDQIIDFIVQFEGFRSTTYHCSAGVLSIGYGTRAKYEGQTITEEDARKEVFNYLQNVTYKRLEKYDLTDSQKIALASFDYNTNKVENLFNNGKLECKRILKYVNVCNEDGCKPLYGLQKRRLKEYNLCIHK